MKPKDNLKAFRRNPSGYIIIQSITLIRIPFSIIFAILFLSSEHTTLTLVLSIVLLILIEVTDAIDGKIARRFDLVSEYGATLDPFSDSITRLIIYWSLASKNFVIFLVPLSMAVRDITVAYSRIILAQKKRSVSARISGKIKAFVQAIGSFLALLGPLYWNHTGPWIIYMLSWIIISVTLLSAVEYVKDAVSALIE